ncbi:MAG: phosphoribosylformylglycinamidine synthase subunit PurQ [Patescibacteria group bacterium]|nr:phosphoribosylformylglycinamidine synthase subunit PurQ [Patescibacteria group bacterium]
MTTSYKLQTTSSGKSKPHVLIFSGYGLNTEDETKTAFEIAGASADIIHINDVISRPSLLKKAQIAVVPGGFSYGDDTGGGKAYGNKLKQHLGDALKAFLERDTLMAGICNGFQILTSADILPGALIANDSARYSCRWVDIEVQNDSPWLKDMTRFSVPIAHGEGKFYAPPELLKELWDSRAVALRYVRGETSEYFELPYNPNGSLEDIAGVSAHGGRVLGLMPHPERAVSFTQLPHWTALRESYLRAGLDIPHEGPGLQIFKNAVNYFTA